MNSLTTRLQILIALLTIAAIPGLVGCISLDLDSARTLANVVSFGSEQSVELRRTPKNPLAEPLNLIGWGGPEPTERTTQLLRRFDLTEAYKISPEAALLDLHQRQIDEPSLDKLHSLAELSYIHASKADARSNEENAMNLYGSTMVYAYTYLFDPYFQRTRNEFDPEFRSASDLYNGALEGLLRIIDEQGNLRPGYVQSLNTVGKRIDFEIQLRGPWHQEDFSHFEFVSDYRVNGLNNTYHTYGLGVPLIAVRKAHENQTPEEMFYPKNLTFSVTAFFRVLTMDGSREEFHYGNNLRCAIELHDPMRETSIEIAGSRIPLESDITTPLAYYLNDPLVRTNTVATLSLLNAEFGKNFRGLYMLEPYDPERIPVVMVHGLWSSPVTWMEMFNDLRALPEIRDNYQFWFYMYPTGQPFWISAAQMRTDLAQAQQVLDPYDEAASLDQMVLVGHSMGGLVSRMQTMYSEDDFWSIMSTRPFQELQADQPTKSELASMWFFEPNPSIRRVITIGTPHRGSEFANSATRLLGRSLFTLPQMLLRSTKEVVRENPDYFENTELLTITTSVDSLAEDSPVLPVMMQAEVAPWVTHHNIVGRNPSKSLLTKIGLPGPKDGDGVVSLASASFDNVNSQIEVPAAHSDIHQHPRAILEVRRVLLEHLAMSRSDRTWDPALQPASHREQDGVSVAERIDHGDQINASVGDSVRDTTPQPLNPVREPAGGTGESDASTVRIQLRDDEPASTPELGSGDVPVISPPPGLQGELKSDQQPPRMGHDDLRQGIQNESGPSPVGNDAGPLNPTSFPSTPLTLPPQATPSAEDRVQGQPAITPQNGTPQAPTANLGRGNESNPTSGANVSPPVLSRPAPRQTPTAKPAGQSSNLVPEFVRQRQENQ